MNLTVFIHYMKLLTAPARLNIPAEDYAKNLIMFVPADEFPVIEEILRQDNRIEYLAAINPAVMQYRKWFCDFADYVEYYLIRYRKDPEKLTNELMGFSVAAHEDDNPASTGTQNDNPVGNS